MQQKPQYRDRVIVLDSDVFDISQSRLQLKQPGPHTVQLTLYSRLQHGFDRYLLSGYAPAVLLHLEPTEALH